MSLSTRIHATIGDVKADPDSGETQPSVSATLVDGHARLSSGPFIWDSDLGPAVGGENPAPSPTAYLLGALAGCGVVFLRDTLAPLFDVTLDGVQATAACRSDIAGLLGVEGADPELTDITLRIHVASADPAERGDAMLTAWRERCPIYLALLNPSRVSVEIEASAR